MSDDKERIDDLGGTCSDTLSVTEGEFDQVLGWIRSERTFGDTYLSVDRIVVETDDGGELELTAEDGNIEVREID